MRIRRTRSRVFADDNRSPVGDPSCMPTRIATRPRDGEPDEVQRVLQWRITRLQRAGYDEESAVRLARAPVDLHTAIDLLERGCPPELAVQILD
jgi:hypothetical protein